MNPQQAPRGAQAEADWLRLIRSENVGPATFWGLLKRHGSAAAALEALPEIASRAGLKRPIVRATADEVTRERARAERLGVGYLFLGAPGYPERLARIHAPPPVITVRGDTAVLSRAPLGVVGARKASAAGCTLSARFAEAFGAAGRTVVSGLALGIDAAAHRAALPFGTVAVVAGGVDRPTPEEHIALADEIIASGGAVVSEMPLGFNPRARDYPRRNRLIAGLSDGVVVIEAAHNSGSLHTARYAADENRELFAVPGSPLDPRAAGCLQLLQSGAGMAVTARDVLDGVARWDPPEPRFPGFADDADQPLPPAAMERVAASLSLTPVTADDLIRQTGLSAGAVMAALVELQVAGRAEEDVDGTVRAISPA
ncbi:DNA-processing protein DprA [Acuticoccus sp. MNP-M23]|uniref:DNA-processing protein DprA n=1 Tax=Acuticoccus sp. MNP-M23 TaxID=3072793 RepID=UPI002814D99C|nr:DNA-processing protein DprA [Acuticoccus sp. MNP-M23]WMS43407.1 DNA-processing protein DprA [Acuticoccus sp. MNP-M23]